MKQYSNEGSPYWNDHRAESEKDPCANPDILAEAYTWINVLELGPDEEENLQAYERVISKFGLCFLTRKQMKVWKLFIQGTSLPDIANMLRIKLPGVYQHLSYIGKKFKKRILIERNGAYVSKTK